MIIEVFVENWQLDCCGEPFDVGATVTWGIYADKPANSTDEIRAFIEDHHDGVDDTVPFWDVSGQVAAIFAVSNRIVSVPGATFTTNDSSDVREERVSRATRFRDPPHGFTPMGFRVRLSVDDEVKLPEYVEAPWVAERREQEKVEEEWLAAFRESDEGQRLSDLCTDLGSRFAGRIEILRSDRTTGVTIQPLLPGRCEIKWECFVDAIRAWVGEGEWLLPASIEGVSELERFVEAAAVGEVRERVLPDRLATIILQSDVEFARADVPFTAPQGTGMFIGTSEFDRYQRGDLDYAPW